MACRASLQQLFVHAAVRADHVREVVLGHRAAKRARRHAGAEARVNAARRGVGVEDHPRFRLAALVRAVQSRGLLNGPVVNPGGRADVVTSQSQVDELLESLGF